MSEPKKKKATKKSKKSEQPDQSKVDAAQAQMAVHRMAATYLAVPAGAIQSVVGVEGVQDVAKITLLVSTKAMAEYQQRVAMSDLRAREAVGK